MSLTLVIVITIAIIGYVINTYNKAVKLRNYVREAFSTMDVYLKKRWDLIPNLVETVKGYAQHEKGVLEEVTNLRTKNYGSMSENEKLEANMQLGVALPKILAVAENYPDLKANQSFAQLMSDLSSIENDIANSRKYYNGTAREYNTFLEVFPSNIVCGIFGFQQFRLYEISETERENVQVKF